MEPLDPDAVIRITQSVLDAFDDDEDMHNVMSGVATALGMIIALCNKSGLAYVDAIRIVGQAAQVAAATNGKDFTVRIVGATDEN